MLHPLSEPDSLPDAWQAYCLVPPSLLFSCLTLCI